MANVMIASVYDALRSAQGPDDRARAATQNLAGYDGRFHAIEHRIGQLDGKLAALRSETRGELSLLGWMVCANAALTVGVLVRLFVQ